MSIQQLIKPFLVGLIALTSSISILAQDNSLDGLLDLSLDELLNIEIEVSSSKGETIFKTPSTVSVIDGDMIKQYGFLNVAEAINVVAGMQVTRTYLKRGLPTSRGILQDNYANKVLVLINNVPTWHAVTGEGNLDRININDVERIEVLKGPASVLYGTNAYSGAVNIVLKKPVDGESASVHAGFGDNFTYLSGGNYAYLNNNISFFVSANSEAGQGYKAEFIDETGADGFVHEHIDASNFTFSGAYKKHALFFNGYRAAESYLGVTPRYTGGAGNDQILNGYLFSYKGESSFNEKTSAKYGVVYDWNDRDIARTIDDSVRADIKGFKAMAFLKGNVELAEALNLEAGIDYDYRKSALYRNYNPWADQAIDENNMKDQTVSEISAFAQAGYSVEKFTILAGGRFTNNEHFGSNVSVRGTAVLSLNETNSFKFIFGQSYRAPSLFELYFQTSSNTVFGNEDLEPETSNSIEVAYVTALDKLMIQALGFHAAYDNKVYRETATITRDGTTYNNVSVYTNGNTFTANGVELELKYFLPKNVSAFLNIAYIDGDNGDELNGNGVYNFKYVPAQTATFGLLKYIGAFYLSGSGNYISKVDGPLEEIDAQFYLDLNVGMKSTLLSKKVTHMISIKNVADEKLLVPEYVRRRVLNAIPLGLGRRIVYHFKMTL